MDRVHVTTLPADTGRIPRVAWLLLSLAVALGLGTTMVIWQWVSHIVEQRNQSEIVAQAAQLGVHLQRRFDDSLLPVSSLAVFHATTADADARTFRLMAESANRLGVPASRLGWEPRVAHADRAAHEAAVALTGKQGYRIVTIGDDGGFVPAPDRDEYFPILFEVLAPGFASTIGFDIASTPDRRPHVEQARRVRGPIGVIPRIRQARLNATPFLVIYWPVFAGTGTTQPDTADGLRGYVTAVVRLEDLFRHLLLGLPPMEGRLVLHAAEWDTAVAATHGHYTEATGLLLGAPASVSPHALRQSFTSLGMAWHIDYEPSAAERERWRRPVAIYFVASGLAMTLAIALILYFLMRQVALERDMRTLSQTLLEQQTTRAHEVEVHNAQLQSQERVARNAALVRTRLLASASHDVRQPLQTMLVHVGRVELGASDPATLRAVAGIKSAVAAMRSMFGVFLDLHRLDEDKVTVEHGFVDVATLLRGLHDAFAPEAARKNLRLRLHAPPCIAWTDRAVLEVILRNLIGNAIKFTSRGGVLVALRRRRALEIQVWDTGPGIAPELLPLIFEEFAQGSDDRSGAGLGLSIAQRMARLLEARITVASRLGHGSRFSLSLPRDDFALPDLAAGAAGDRGVRS